MATWDKIVALEIARDVVEEHGNATNKKEVVEILETILEIYNADYTAEVMLAKEDFLRHANLHR